MKRLEEDYYLGNDVLQIAGDLIGKFLVTNIDGKLTSGLIIETEAYNGMADRASHAYNGRRTKRNEIMYSRGGVAYVYLCYGVHHLFNIVTNSCDVPHAILIRAIVAMDGIDTMLQRREQSRISGKFTDGPGTLSRALGIKTKHSGIPLNGNLIWLEDREYNFGQDEIDRGPRIGVTYAGKDALLPYRYRLDKKIIAAIANERHKLSL